MKINIKKLISSLKEASKQKPVAKNVKSTNSHRERDMRQDAMDMGAHQSKDYFGGKDV